MVALDEKLAQLLVGLRLGCETGVQIGACDELAGNEDLAEPHLAELVALAHLVRGGERLLQLARPDDGELRVEPDGALELVQPIGSEVLGAGQQ